MDEMEDKKYLIIVGALIFFYGGRMFTDFTTQVCATCPVLWVTDNDGRCLIVAGGGG